MKFVREVKNAQIVTAILFLCLFVVYGYGICQIYGMVEYPDEFGYWSSAAKLLGWDWSQITSRGAYYSFGYSLLLFPVLKFCEDSVLAYRMAVTLNFVMMAFSFFLLKGISKRIFTEQVEEERIFSIGMAVLYPPWLFYSQTTMVDSFLIFMVILICYLWVRFLQTPNFRWGIALTAAVLYNYTLHMRAAGTLVVFLIVMTLWLAENKEERKKFLVLLFIALCLFFVAEYGKEVVQQNVFAGADKELLSVNDYEGQLTKLTFLVQPEGMRQLFFVVMGKVLYIGLSGIGLVYASVIWCVRQYLQRQKHKENKNKIRMWFGIFLFLGMLGQCAICVIYTIGSENADWLIYGRYVEAFVPMGIFVGSSYLFSLPKKTTDKAWISFAILDTVAAFCCIYRVWGQEKTFIRGEHSVAAAFLSGTEGVNPVMFFVSVWIAGLLFMLVLRAAFETYKRKRNFLWIPAVVFTVMLLWQYQAGSLYIYQANYYMSGEQVLVNVVKEQLAEGKTVYYLEEDNADWISYVQMQLREHSISVIRVEELERLESKNAVVLVDGKSDYLDYMETHYAVKIPGRYHYAFYFNHK